jgi:hypothetical protein
VLGLAKAYKLKFVSSIFIVYFVTVFDCTAALNNTEKEDSLETKIVNISADKYDEYIGRGSDPRTHMLTGKIKPGERGWLGNPHPIGLCDICSDSHTRDECIKKFEEDFSNKINSDENFKSALLELKGKRLGCYCKPENCHGDVIKAWLDSKAEK